MSPSSSPPPLPEDDTQAKRRSNEAVDPASDENIHPLDPRRFTPTLHANLVSEILSLRRDLENKTKHIEHLESDLHSTQQENEQISERYTTSSKETRSLKRQMQLLEGGTLNALNEIAKERDTAQNDVSELRRRLEQSQKKARSQEENAERAQALLEREKDAWHSEKRALETKVHVVEGRLKTVLDEVAKTHFHSNGDINGHIRHDSHHSSQGRASKRSSTAFDTRRESNTSNSSQPNGGRFSAHLLTTNGLATSLADELAVDEGDGDFLEEDDEGHESPDALPEEQDRSVSVQSKRSAKAYRILGISPETEDHDLVDQQQDSGRPVGILPAFAGKPIGAVGPPRQYTDSAVQCSPPPSPKLPIMGNAHMMPKLPPLSRIDEGFASEPSDMQPISPVSAMSSPSSRHAPLDQPSVAEPKIMVPASTQTVAGLPSPPDTPAQASRAASLADTSLPARAEMTTTSTQTDTLPEVSQLTIEQSLRRQTLEVPTIAIIPPSSRPSTPTTDVKLPPQTKNASCQSDLPAFPDYTSTSMQTEDIRVDRRPIEIPPHLLPSAIRAQAVTESRASTSSPPSAIPNSSRRRFRQPPPVQPVLLNSKRGPRGPISHRGPRGPISHRGAQPPYNDNGPLTELEESPVKRPARSSSMFAGFDEASDDDSIKLPEIPQEEEDIFDRPTKKYIIKYGKLVAQERLEEEDSDTFATEAGENIALENLRQSEDTLPSNNSRTSSGRQSPPRRGPSTEGAGQSGARVLRRVPSAKQTNFRRAAMISSGTAAHSSSSQSRTLGAPFDPRPGAAPFPVPIRFSSMAAKVPRKTVSEGGRSTTPTSGMSPTKKRKGKVVKPDLRKVRSATNVSPGRGLSLDRSRSPPLDPRVSIVPELPSFPPMPNDNISIRRGQGSQKSQNGTRPPPVAGRQPSHTKSESLASSVEQTSVVEAIAQTMVGEWMFKYVRRRKSFGVPESKPFDWDPSRNAEEISANATSTGVRHKRWVWVAPYDRAIMWSSKQPTSGNALLGKSGRKLTVQSVLDVKDDNPLPKNSGNLPQFNRSILVLTPERALKFTALTRERHYVWLTALSFLSHSPLTVGDLAALPPIPHENAAPPPSTAMAGSLRRRNIRDSILMSKGAGRAGPRSFTADAVMQPVPNYNHEEVIADHNLISDAALPPTIPRHSHHNRKRSNTAPRVPPPSFRSFSEKSAMSMPRPSASYSMATTTAASSDAGRYTPSLGMRSVQSSRRGSEASTTIPPHLSRKVSASQVNGHTDQPSLSGTMKMNAFIENQFGPNGRQKGSHRTKQGWKKDMQGYWGVDTPADQPPLEPPIRRTVPLNRPEDPFRGF